MQVVSACVGGDYGGGVGGGLAGGLCLWIKVVLKVVLSGSADQGPVSAMVSTMSRADRIQSIVERLDEMGFPLDASANEAHKALRAAHDGRKRDDVLVAVKVRREPDGPPGWRERWAAVNDELDEARGRLGELIERREALYFDRR